MARKAENLNAKTVRLLEENGFLADVVERANRAIRQDFLGFIDVVGVSPEGVMVGLQVTSHGNRASRKAKILDSDLLSSRCSELVRRGVIVEIWGWKTRNVDVASSFSVLTAVITDSGGLFFSERVLTGGSYVCEVQNESG